APGEAIARVSAGDPLPGRRLLVVDNETEILFSMSALLGQWGCEVLTATDLEGASKALRAARRMRSWSTTTWT
ncbi:hypothetical protein, partial [Acinetobacter baumannii]|uniref:hypothetical protein n=1 Tax=Acinetobacter baumannii TaxID=470 RepID=UPI0020911C70